MKLCKTAFPINVSNRYTSKQSMTPYIVGVATSSNSSFLGIKESIQQGFTSSSLEKSIVKYYLVDDSEESMTKAVNDFINDSQNYSQRAFIASTNTSDFRVAMNLLPSDVLVLSIASTASDISFAKSNGLSMAYSDSIAADSLVLAMIYNRDETLSPQKLYIVSLNNSSYAEGYINDIQSALTMVPPRTITFSGVYKYDNTMELNNSLQNVKRIINTNDILVYIGNASDFDSQSQTILSTMPEIFMYATDLADGLNFDYPNLKTYVSTNSYMNYTNATKDLYSNLYSKYPSLLNYVSAYAPFAFDCSRQLDFMIQNNLDFTTKNFTVTQTTGIYQKAALETNWINVDKRRPEFGLNWLTQTRDEFWSNHIQDFNRMTLGTVHTLPRSAANGMRLGKSSWVDKNGYLITILWWDDVYNKNDQWIFTRLTTQGLIIDTSIPYQSDQNRNSSSGTYLLQFDVAVAPAYVKDNQTDVKKIPSQSQFPLSVTRTKLLI